MKSSEDFQNDIFRKRDARLKSRKKWRRLAILALPLAAAVLAAEVAVPRLWKGPNAAGNTPLTLRAGPGEIRALSVRDLCDQKDRELYGENGLLREDPSKEEITAAEEEWAGKIDEVYKELEQNAVDPGFSQGVNLFARDCAQALSETQLGENACYSPLSLYFALAMLGSGARGETAEEFSRVLHAEDLDWACGQCGNYYRQHYRDGPSGKFQIANSLWLSDNCDFEEDFLDNASGNFYASSFNADFTSPDVGEAISKWIADNTGGLLSPELEFNPKTMLALVNTVYLFDQWNDEFLPENNTREDFTKADGSTVTAEYMHRVDDAYAFFGDSYTRASIPLQESGEMVFILPDEGVAAEDLLRDPDVFEGMFFPQRGEDPDFCQVEWSVPKFSFDTDYKLIDALSGLGLESALSPYSADFSGVGFSPYGPLYLSQARHGAHIGVNEQGVEATAYTMLALEAGGAMPPDRIVKMDLNRPFLFAILSHDRVTESDDGGTLNGTLLFVGMCGDPTQ